MNPEVDKELDDIMARKKSELLTKAQLGEAKSSSISGPITLTDSNFEQALKDNPLLVVDFWAVWCGPCRMVAPVIEQLSSELAGRAVFGKLNVDENPEISRAFGIQSIPTIAIFKNGKAVDAIVGAVSKSQMQSTILKYL
ncbi:MAG TPA: thioredoxin [Nitrososphaeraceae archaeon]|jgi:thioredoxin 1